MVPELSGGRPGQGAADEDVRACFQVEARLWFTDLKPEQIFVGARENVPGRQNSKQIPSGKNSDGLILGPNRGKSSSSRVSKTPSVPSLGDPLLLFPRPFPK